MASRPLRLKDFLELDCDASSGDGFRCYPRRLGGTGAPAAPIPRTHSLHKLSYLSRNLSRRLRGGFWKRREEEGKEEVPSPVVSSCSCSSESESDSGLFERKSETESESEFSSASLESLAGVGGAAGDHEPEAPKLESKECSSFEMDDKEQLSPVSVMDFPFDDNGEDDDVVAEEEREAGACSPSFSESLAHLQRSKMPLLHKIRRFESLTELGPVDLDASFAASESEGHVDAQLQCYSSATTPSRPNDHPRYQEEHEQDERHLIGLLMDTVGVRIDDMTGRLLIDFFVEKKCEFEHAFTNPFQKLQLLGNSGMMEVAKSWVEGRGPKWGLRDVLCRGEEAVAEMEQSRRWMCVSEEEPEVGTTVERLVMKQLVDELVRDLVS